MHSKKHKHCRREGILYPHSYPQTKCNVAIRSLYRRNGNKFYFAIILMLLGQFNLKQKTLYDFNAASNLKQTFTSDFYHVTVYDVIG